MKNLYKYIKDIKYYNMNKYISKIITFIETILKDKYISKEFQTFLINLTIYFNK